MNWAQLLLASLLLSATATAAPSPAKTYGSGGRGLHATSRLDYSSVVSCLFELVDINHDTELTELELRIALTRWVSTTEQVLGGLTVHRFMAQCDTDNSRTVSWKEATENPHCLTIGQTEDVAKWMCSRARHGDFAFDQYVAVTVAMRDGLASGNGMRSIASQFRVLMDSQNDARRAALARTLHTERFSDEIDSLIAGLGSVSTVLTLPIAGAIIAMTLFVSCLI